MPSSQKHIRTGRPLFDLSGVARAANPMSKVLVGLGVLFVLIAIILIPSGISTLLKGNITSGISLLVAGGILGYASYFMLMQST